MNNFKGLKICFSLLAIIVLCTCYIGCLLTSNDFVHADYEDILLDSNVLVNFNQLINYTNLNSNSFAFKQSDYFIIDGVVSSEAWISIGASSGFVNGHKYFLNVAQEDNSLVQFVIDNSTLRAFDDYVITMSGYSDGATIYLRCLANTYSDYTVQFYVVDLTQMFGSGNEPNLIQCEELFVSDYYNYNTGTAISLNGLNAYAQGVASVLESTELLNVGPGDFLNSAESFTYNEDYSGLAYVEGSWLELIRNNDNANASGIMRVPLVESVPVGSKCTISVESYADFGPGSDTNNYFQLACIVNGNLHIIANSPIIGSQLIFSDVVTFDFVAPYTLSDIYIISYRGGYTYYFRDFSMYYKVLNLEILQRVSYDSGWENASKYYTQGNPGYQAIYDKGYYAYPEDDHFTFQKLISSVIDVPIQAFTNLFDYDILGVNMKTFYLSIFTLCVIITIIRLVL